MELDVGRVAFEGIRQLGRKPWAPLVWAAAWFTAFFVVVGGAMGVAFLVRGVMPRAGEGGSFATIVGLLVIVGAAVLTCVCLCAAYRMVLQPQKGLFGYLRLGMAELRMLGLMLLNGLFWLLVAFAFFMVIGFLSVSVGDVIPDAGQIAITIAMVLPFLVLSVRLSLAGVINFAEGKLGLVESWRMTRPVFWRLTGICAIGLAMVAAVCGIGFAVARAVGAPFPTADTAWAFSLAALLGSFVLTAVNLLLLAAPHAAAYAALTPRSVDKTADAFS